MYQFTTTTILNSSLDSNGVTAKYSADANALTVTRVGKFKVGNIVSVYKQSYAAGVKEVATITVPATTSGKVLRLEVDVRLSQSTQSEYANTYLYFKKPVVVEVLATGTIDTDGAALVAQIKGLKDRYGVSYIQAVYNSADNNTTTVTFPDGSTLANATANSIILKATDNAQRFFSVKLLQEAASYNTIIQPEYDVLQSTFTITTAGKNGFGDDAYMIKSLMIPTQENVRYFGINAEERPVLGGNYDQYTLRYQIAKSDDGIVAGGNSITTHVFYVKSDLTAAFADLFTNDAKLNLDAAGKYTVIS